MRYFYLEKEKAKIERLCVVGIYEEKLEEYNSDVIEYYAEDLPPKFTYDGTMNTIIDTSFEIDFGKEKTFYFSELNLSTKAHVEYIVGILSEDEFEEIKQYLQEINPFKKNTKNLKKSVKRPEILDRYK